MKISEIANYLLARNGQHIVGDYSKQGFNMTALWSILEPEIKNYQSFVPLIKKFNIKMSANHYDFTFDTHNVGYVNAQSPGEYPVMLSSVVPIVAPGYVFPLGALFNPFTASQHLAGNEVINPTNFPWEYRKPVLYCPAVSVVDITASYKYQTIISTDAGGLITEVEVVDIEKDDNYFVLLQILSGRLLLSLSKSRRAFTYSDLPITTDAATLAQEAQREYDDGLKMLHSRHNWWEGLHV
jgi:hypothetical protein